MTVFDDFEGAAPLISSVFHPSDFSPESELAFAHALAIALLTRSSLTILNAGRRDLAERDWSEFPGVRKTLERWRLLEPGSPRSAVFESFGVKVKKVAVRSRNPGASVLEWVADNEPDLIVLATGGGEALPAWLRTSLGGRIAAASRTAALFVPPGRRGFVQPENGDLLLRRVLVPVAASPEPRPGLVAAYRLAKRMSDGAAEVTLLHVGSQDTMPELALPDDPQVAWRTRVQGGDVIDAVVRVAEDTGADAIVMPTDGRNGFLDVLRGSHSEQLLPRSPCPLVTVPSMASGEA
jgi:nucleotide-binding universal stress UspA family protein